MNNIRPLPLIQGAYRLPIGRVVGAPEWARSDHFDIDAQVDGDSSGDQMGTLLRRILVEKFNLIAHRETRDLPIYGLMLARSDGTPGPRARTSACSRKDPEPPGPYVPG